MSDKAALIKKASLFQSLTDSQVKSLASLAKEESVKSGKPLIKESEIGSTIYLITKGRVDVEVSIPGDDCNTEVIATLKDGDVVGEMILLGRERRSAHVKARDDVNTLAWNRDDLLKLFEQDTGIGYTVMKDLASLLAERLLSTNLVLRNVLTVPRSVIM